MHNEQIFTPDWVVNMMLNKIGYIPSADIHDKHIIDNSCGDGAFLAEIVDRYIKHGILDRNISKNELKKGLEKYIHGIEIDNNLCRKTVLRLNSVAAKYSITGVEWDICNADTVDCLNKYKLMDFVVGNPPYCKIHDLSQEIRLKYKQICGNAKGTFDSYVMFFWIGIKMLKRTGKLIYITPSSWTTSLYAQQFREWLLEKDGIISITDMQHKKVFEEATTFTMITELGNWYHNESTKVYAFNEEGICKEVNNVPLKEYKIGDKSNFYFKCSEILSILRHIDDTKTIDKVFTVKNGFATLNDKLFIGKMSEMAGFLGDPNMIFCTKASKNILQSIIYPYDKEGKPLKFEELSIPIQNILLQKAYELKVDTAKENWYLYGRSQAINDVNKNKYAINNLIKTREDIKLHYCCSETGIYSGFYILSKDDFRSSEVRQFVEETINSNEFVNYIHSLGRYKNGGFSTFTTKELEKYLNFKWKERKNIFLTNFYDEKFGCIENK